MEEFDVAAAIRSLLSPGARNITGHDIPSTPAGTYDQARCTMPLIQVKATDRRFADPAAAERLITALTGAACQVWGEDTRPDIWVMVEPVPAQHWGVGGKPLG